MDFFENWEEFYAKGASVPFYRKSEGGVDFIGFDTRECTPPAPMVNALAALNLVTDANTRVVMINHMYPAGLIPKIADKFEIERENLEGKEVKLTFTLKTGASVSKFDTAVTCDGV